MADNLGNEFNETNAPLSSAPLPETEQDKTEAETISEKDTSADPIETSLPSALPKKRKKRKWFTVLIFCVVLLFLLAAGAHFFVLYLQNRVGSLYIFETIENEIVIVRDGRKTDCDIKGTLVDYTANYRMNAAFFTVRIAEKETLYFVDRNGVFRIGNDSEGICLSYDGKKLLYRQDNELMLYENERSTILQSDVDEVVDAAISKNGKHIAFITRKNGSQDAALFRKKHDNEKAVYKASNVNCLYGIDDSGNMYSGIQNETDVLLTDLYHCREGQQELLLKKTRFVVFNKDMTELLAYTVDSGVYLYQNECKKNDKISGNTQVFATVLDDFQNELRSPAARGNSLLLQNIASIKDEYFIDYSSSGYRLCRMDKKNGELEILSETAYDYPVNCESVIEENFYYFKESDDKYHLYVYDIKKDESKKLIRDIDSCLIDRRGGIYYTTVDEEETLYYRYRDEDTTIMKDFSDIVLYDKENDELYALDESNDLYVISRNKKKIRIVSDAVECFWTGNRIVILCGPVDSAQDQAEVYIGRGTEFEKIGTQAE